METLLKVILFFIGWISGGGILSFLSMLVITSLFGSDFNQAFVGGCMWGTFGVLGGVFMVSCLNTNHHAGSKHPNEGRIEV